MVLININRNAAAEAANKIDRWLPPENSTLLCKIVDVDAEKLEVARHPYARLGFLIAPGQPDANRQWQAAVFVNAYGADCASEAFTSLLDVFFVPTPDGQQVNIDGPTMVKTLLTELVYVTLGKHRKHKTEDYYNATITAFIKPQATQPNPAAPAAAPPPAQPAVPPPPVPNPASVPPPGVPF